MKSVAHHSDLILAVVMADVAIVLLTGAVLGRLLHRLRQPAVIGEIAAGIILGPSLLGLLPDDLPGRIFPLSARPYLSAIAQVGLLLFVFAIGYEFDKGLLRDRRASAATVTAGSMTLPFGLGIALATVLYSQHSAVHGHHVPFSAFALFMGAAMAVTAFPVLARILADNRMMRSPVAALALASAAIGDALAWCLLALVAAIATASGPHDLIQILCLAAIYIAVMALLIRPFLAAMISRYAREHVPPGLVVGLIAGILLSSYVTTWIGVHAIFGAFAFGFVMPREPRETLRAALKGPLEGVTSVLLPVFFIITGLSVNLGGMSTRDYAELAAIVAVACSGKLLGAAVPGRLCGMSWRESGTLGVLMNTRGLTELIILSAGASLGVLDGRMFTMMVLMALITTAMTGPLLSRLWRPGAGDARAPGAHHDLAEARS